MAISTARSSRSCTFRDVEIHMSELMTVDTIFLHMDLVMEGLKHPKPCAKNVQKDDPARGLEIEKRAR